MSQIGELEHQITLVKDGKRYKIAPRRPCDLLASIRLTVKAGGLREDSKKIPGKDGWERTFLGYDDAELTLEITIWDEGELAKIKNLFQIFRPRRGFEGAPLQIIHPAANRWGINSVYIVRPEETPYDPSQGYRLTVSMRQFQSKTEQTTKGTKKMDDELLGTDIDIVAEFGGGTSNNAKSTPPSTRLPK